jgi:hypothetical protein
VSGTFLISLEPAILASEPAAAKDKAAVAKSSDRKPFFILSLIVMLTFSP